MTRALCSTPALNAAESPGQKTRRRSIFASILAALHHSRELQAQRIFHQYRHLIADPEDKSLASVISNPARAEDAQK